MDKKEEIQKYKYLANRFKSKLIPYYEVASWQEGAREGFNQGVESCIATVERKIKKLINLNK